MRPCPSCDKQTLSNFKLWLNATFSFGTLYCSNCHCMIGFKRNISSGFMNAVNMILPEILAFVFMVLSIIFFGNIWVGVGVFILTRLLKSYYIYAGELHNLNSTL